MRTSLWQRRRSILPQRPKGDAEGGPVARRYHALSPNGARLRPKQAEAGSVGRQARLCLFQGCVALPARADASDGIDAMTKPLDHTATRIARPPVATMSLREATPEGSGSHRERLPITGLLPDFAIPGHMRGTFEAHTGRGG
jgi:hypothetical protein